MGERLNAQLLIDGQPLPDDVRLDVFVCDHCDGKGRRMVTASVEAGRDGHVAVYRKEHPCGKCLRSGFVVRLYRVESVVCHG